MHARFYAVPLSALILIFTAAAAFSQAAPAASESAPPLEAGGGFAVYGVSQNGTNRAFTGGAAWVDWKPSMLQQRLPGLSVEGEFRSISRSVGKDKPGTTRMATAGGGVLYAWDRFRSLHPYVKLLVADGWIHFYDPGNPSYVSDSRVIMIPGGGVECPVTPYLRVRGDYELQPWPAFSAFAQGFTLGVTLDFRGLVQR